MSEPHSIHVPVLVEEVLHWLRPLPGQIFVDGTLGGGGHARLIAERVGSQGCVVALDRDPTAVAAAQEVFAGLPIRAVHADFRSLPSVLDELRIAHVDGILIDLGLSSDQLADAARGFSFDSPGPLDLRFDPTTGEPAWRLVNRLGERELADILFGFGEERRSRRIAREIVRRRAEMPIRTSAQLAAVVRRCVPRSKKHPIDPATRAFQALRIAVNDELRAIETALSVIPDCLRAGGRLAMISFHSLEDRRVKHAFRTDPRYMILTKKPIRPNEAEIERNPRSRSAKLRVAERSAGAASVVQD